MRSGDEVLPVPASADVVLAQHGDNATGMSLGVCLHYAWSVVGAGIVANKHFERERGLLVDERFQRLDDIAFMIMRYADHGN